jgi:hypothetical protein
MTTFIVAFEKHNGKQGQRTIKARNEAEAIIKCRSVVANSFWHWIRDTAWIATQDIK